MDQITPRDISIILILSVLVLLMFAAYWIFDKYIEPRWTSSYREYKRVNKPIQPQIQVGKRRAG